MLNGIAGGWARAKALFLRTRNFSAYFILNVLQRSSGLLLLPFYTAALVPADFGIIALCWSFSIVTTIFFLCIPDAMYFSVLRGDEDVEAYHAGGLRIMAAILLAGLVFLGGVYLSGVQAQFAGVALNPHLLLIIAINIVQGVYDSRLQILQGQQRAGTFFWLGLIRIVLQIGTALTILFTAPSVVHLLMGQLAVNLTLFAIVTPWLMAGILYPGRGLYRKCIVFALPLVPHNLAHWGRGNLDRVFLGQFSGTAAVGRYGIAAALASTLAMVTEAYRNFHVPLQFEWMKNPAQEAASLRFFSVASIAGLGIVSLILLAAAPKIYDLFVVNLDYHQGIVALPMLLGSAIAYAIYMAVVAWVFFKESSHVVAINTTAISAVMLPVYWYLIYRFGIVGASVAQLATSAAMAIAIFVRCRRYDGFAIPAAPMFAIAAAVPAIGLTWWLPAGRWPALALAFILCGGIAWREYHLWRRATAT